MTKAIVGRNRIEWDHIGGHLALHHWAQEGVLKDETSKLRVGVGKTCYRARERERQREREIGSVLHRVGSMYQRLATRAAVCF